MFPLSVWGRVVLGPHMVVLLLLVVHSNVLTLPHICFCLLVRVLQGGGVPLPVHMPREVPVGKCLLGL